jgi:hypothetical protein
MKIVKILGCFLLLGVVFLTSFYFLKKKTITNETLCSEKASSVCWGYRVDVYHPRSFCTLTIWHSWRVSQSFSFPNHFVIPNVREQRWLSNGTVFYLYLENVNTDNSYVQNQKMRLIYDFESGQMYTEKYSAHWLNSTFESRNSENLNLSESDFERILADFEKAK